MRGRRHKLQVSTFPFLAVLLCAMGSLILILLVMDRKAHRAAQARAQREAARLAEESAQGQAERERQRQQARDVWEQKRATLHDKLSAEQIAMQLQMRKVRDQLQDIAVRLHYEQDTSTELRHKVSDERGRLDAEHQLLLTLRSTSAQTAHQSKESSKTLHRMTLDLLQMEQALKDLRAARKREEHTFSVVPYHGRRGENRRPIYAECTADSVIFHPERREMPIVPRLFGSADASRDVRGEVERRIAQQRAKLAQLPGNANPTPYLLLLVRPEGINTYHRFQDALKGLSLDFGYEFIDADWVLDFPANDEMPSTQPWMIAGKPSPAPSPLAGSSPPKTNARLAAPAPRSDPGGIVTGGIRGVQAGAGAGTGPWTAGASSTGQGGGGNGATASGNPPASATGMPTRGFQAKTGASRGYAFGRPTGEAVGLGGTPGASGSGGSSLLLGSSAAADSSGGGSSGGSGAGLSLGRRTVGLRRGSGDGGSLAGLAPSLGQGDGGGSMGDGDGSIGGYQGTGTFALRGSNSSSSDLPGLGPPRPLLSGSAGDGAGQSGIAGNSSSGGGLGGGNGVGSGAGGQSGIAGNSSSGGGLGGGNGVGSGAGGGLGGGNGFGSGAGGSAAAGMPSGDGPRLNARGNEGGGSGSALNLGGVGSGAAGAAQPGGQGSAASSLGTQSLSGINSAGQASTGGQGNGVSSLGTQIPSGGNSTGQGSSGPSAGMQSNSGGNSMAQGSTGGQGSGVSSVAAQVQSDGNSTGQGSSDSSGTPSGSGGTTAGPQSDGASSSGSSGRSSDRVIYIDPLTGKPIAGPRATPQAAGDPPPDDSETNHGPPRVRVIVGDGGSGEPGQGQPQAMDRFAPTPVAPPAAPRRRVVPRPAWIHGGRDWTIYVECRGDGLVLYPSERIFPLAQASSETADNPLRAAIQQMIDRRQALRRPDEPPYRPQLCLLVWPEHVRAFLTVYPALEALPMSKMRRNLDPGDDVRTIVTAASP